MTRAMAAAVLLLTMTMAWPVHADVSGPVAAVDGDMIEVAGSRVRLHGIDAPESAQTCPAEDRRTHCFRADETGVRFSPGCRGVSRGWVLAPSPWIGEGSARPRQST